MERMRAVAHPGAGFSVRWIELGGTGRPAVYLHGWGCSSASSFADIARRAGRPAALVDLLGHGLSDRPQGFDYGLLEHADALAAVVRTYPAGVDLIGHSLGGTLALLVADRHPDLVHRLVLIEPAIDAFPVSSSDYAARDEEGLRVDRERHDLDDQTWDRRAEMQLADPIALRRIALSLHDALGDTLHDVLARPKVPTLLVLGGQRSYRAEEDFLLGGVDVHRIPQAGHFVMNEAPDEYDAVTRAFLGGRS